MSFFGFDATLPRDKPQQSKGIFDQQDPFARIQQARRLQAFQDDEDEVLDFEDTYDGLGDRLEETGDDFNDDTFGGGAEGVGAQGSVGKDFDFFGKTAQVSTAIDEEGMRYGLQSHAKPPISTAVSKPKRSGYEAYKDPGYIPDIQAKSGFWTSKQQQPPQPPSAQSNVRNEPAPASVDGRISTARPPATAAAPPPAPATAASYNRKMMSLEEVEAMMRTQPAPYPQPDRYPPPQQMPQPDLFHRPPPAPSSHQPMPPQQHVPHPSQSAAQRGQQPLQILQNPNRSRNSPLPAHARMPSQPNAPLPGGLPVITHPSQLMDLSEEQKAAFLEDDAKRAKRNHKIFQLSKGNGLMTPQDKSFITRIQLQQLVAATGNSADPDPEAVLVEDFYYQVYSQIRGAPRQHPTQPLGHFAQTYLFQTGGRHNNRRHNLHGDNHMQRMQQQVQRAVEAAKLKPKNKQLIIEGSLGKISFSNAKTPKPLLNLKKPENVTPSSPDARPTTANSTKKPSDRKAILHNIESVYTTLMAMEDLERRIPPPLDSSDPDSVAAHDAYRQGLATLNAQLWSALHIMDPINPQSSTAHPFIAFLSYTKGKKAIPRIFRQIDSEQRVTILTMIIVHLDHLDVIRYARPPGGETQPSAHVREEIEQFSVSVIPSLISYTETAAINIASGLLQLLIDHTSLPTVARTKIGLTMLTMLLSRAEIIKENENPPELDTQSWQQHFNRFFDLLEPLLADIFVGPVNSGDDMYVWQFLAAVGIGASPEQQQRLVLGVKERVLDTVAQSRALPGEMGRARLGNVNLFMKAIGLDVDMLG